MLKTLEFSVSAYQQLNYTSIPRHKDLGASDLKVGKDRLRATDTKHLICIPYPSPHPWSGHRLCPTMVPVNLWLGPETKPTFDLSKIELWSYGPAPNSGIFHERSRLLRRGLARFVNLGVMFPSHPGSIHWSPTADRGSVCNPSFQVTKPFHA